MAKTNMLMREKRRLKVAKKYARRRAELKELIRDPKTGAEERAAANQRLAAIDQQLATLQSQSSATARQLDAARKLLAAHEAELDEQAKHLSAIAAQASRQSDLAQLKVTTLA